MSFPIDLEIDDILQPESIGQNFGMGLTSPTSPSAFGGIDAFGLIGVGSSVMKGIGGYMQGQEEAAADKYNAELALLMGQFQTEKIGMEEEQTLSTQKAMYAKAGVEMSGSPLDTALQTATNYEYDKQIATFNARSRANMYEYEAKVAEQKGKFSLGMGLLEGAGSMALMLL